MFSMKQKVDIKLYSAEAASHSLIFHLREILRELPKSHELGYRLFKRNLTALYRQSLLGFGWALLPPFATAALWIFLRGNNAVLMGETGIPYPVYVLTGTMLWQIFSEAISAPINQMIQNKAMITKVNIPREGILLSGIYELLFNILVKLILLGLVYVYFQQPVKILCLVFVPLGIFSISLAGFAVGLVLAPLGMLYQDFGKGLAVILPFLMYLTPVVFPIPEQGKIHLLMKWNPLSTLIVQTRNWFTAQPVSETPAFLAYSAVFFLLFLVCLVAYRISLPMLVERMGS